MNPWFCPSDLIERAEKLFEKLIECPTFEHGWFSNWVDSNFKKFDHPESDVGPFVDQLTIQV